MDKYEKRRLNLIELRHSRCGGSNAALARLIGREPSYVTRMAYPEGKSGKKRIAEDMVDIIEAAFSLPKGWMDRRDIALEDGPDSKAIVTSSRIIPQSEIKMVPLISSVQAGAMSEAVDPYAVGDAEKWIPVDLPNLSPNAFALRVKGESMLPEFVEGDIIIVDPDIEPDPGRYVVAKNGKNEATFKQYRQRGHNDKGEMVIELVPLNSSHPPIRSDVTPIKIIGTVVYVMGAPKK